MKDLMEFLKSISDETRLRILMLLHERELCVCELCDVLGESQPKISRHLARLRNAEIVKDLRRGQWVFYSLEMHNKAEIEILKVIRSTIEDHPILHKDVQKLLEKIEKDNFCER